MLAAMVLTAGCTVVPDSAVPGDAPTLADLAPTQASLLRFGGFAPPGQDTPADQRIFRAAYPSAVFEDLPCLPEAA